MIKKRNPIKAVIFDMGNVVLKVDHWVACEKFSQYSDLTKEEIYERIIGSSLEDLFERGRISPLAFYLSISKKIHVDMDFEQFSRIYNDVFFTNNGMSEVLKRLKKEVKILLLSNTNQSHFSWVDQKFSILKNFKERVLSYKVGFRKPEKEIFLHALDMLRFKPEETVYIDDLEEFVSASEKIGMNGIVFRSFSFFQTELANFIG